MGKPRLGPWTVELHHLSEGPAWVVYDANGYRIADYLDEATAHLIAAAPDLAKALHALLPEECLRKRGNARPSFSDHERARIVYERATGVTVPGLSREELAKAEGR